MLFNILIPCLIVLLACPSSLARSLAQRPSEGTQLIEAEQLLQMAEVTSKEDLRKSEQLRQRAQKILGGFRPTTEFERIGLGPLLARSEELRLELRRRENLLEDSLARITEAVRERRVSTALRLLAQLPNFAPLADTRFPFEQTRRDAEAADSKAQDLISQGKASSREGIGEAAEESFKRAKSLNSEAADFSALIAEAEARQHFLLDEREAIAGHLNSRRLFSADRRMRSLTAEMPANEPRYGFLRMQREIQAGITSAERLTREADAYVQREPGQAIKLYRKALETNAELNLEQKIDNAKRLKGPSAAKGMVILAVVLAALGGAAYYFKKQEEKRAGGQTGPSF